MPALISTVLAACTLGSRTRHLPHNLIYANAQSDSYMLKVTEKDVSFWECAPPDCASFPRLPFGETMVWCENYTDVVVPQGSTTCFGFYNAVKIWKRINHVE